MIRYSSKKLLIASDEWDILYHRGVLYQYVKNENKYKEIIELYASGLKKVFSKVRLAERLLRLEPRTA